MSDLTKVRVLEMLESWTEELGHAGIPEIRKHLLEKISLCEAWLSESDAAWLDKHGDRIRRALNHTIYDGPAEMTWWEKDEYKETRDAVDALIDKREGQLNAPSPTPATPSTEPP